MAVTCCSTPFILGRKETPPPCPASQALGSQSLILLQKLFLLFKGAQRGLPAPEATARLLGRGGSTILLGRKLACSRHTKDSRWAGTGHAC